MPIDTTMVINEMTNEKDVEIARLTKKNKELYMALTQADFSAKIVIEQQGDKIERLTKQLAQSDMSFNAQCASFNATEAGLHNEDREAGEIK